jgi:hypothetical protein
LLKINVVPEYLIPFSSWRSGSQQLLSTTGSRLIPPSAKGGAEHVARWSDKRGIGWKNLLFRGVGNQLLFPPRGSLGHTQQKNCIDLFKKMTQSGNGNWRPERKITKCRGGCLLGIKIKITLGCLRQKCYKVMGK